MTDSRDDDGVDYISSSRLSLAISAGSRSRSPRVCLPVCLYMRVSRIARLHPTYPLTGICRWTDTASLLCPPQSADNHAMSFPSPFSSSSSSSSSSSFSPTHYPTLPLWAFGRCAALQSPFHPVSSSSPGRPPARPPGFTPPVCPYTLPYPRTYPHHHTHHARPEGHHLCGCLSWFAGHVHVLLVIVTGHGYDGGSCSFLLLVTLSTSSLLPLYCCLSTVVYRDARAQ